MAGEREPEPRPSSLSGKLDLDRLLTWLLMALSTATFSWFASEVKAMSAKLESMNVRVSVMEALRLDDRIRALEGRK